MRPKTFDQTQALEAAMLQFWESGFEGSSMQNLVDRMGISRQSLYDTYGNKREPFQATLKKCCIASGMGLHVLRRLPDRGHHIRPSIESILIGLRASVAEH